MTIRNLNDLIRFIEDDKICLLYPRIRRAIVEGTTENLGIFRWIPGTLYSSGGWVVIVKGKRNEWIITIKPRQFEGYRCYVLKEIPWKYWVGDSHKDKLFQGDDPEKYKLLRKKELK